MNFKLPIVSTETLCCVRTLDDVNFLFLELFRVQLGRASKLGVTTFITLINYE